MNVETLPAVYAPAGRLAVARWLGYLMLVDLLFLPYFQLVIMPFSLPLALLGLGLMRVRFRNDHYLALFLFIGLGVFVSLGLAMFDPRLSDWGIENLKRAVQLLSTFAYFFYFRWLAANVALRVEGVALLFTAWFGTLAVAFYLDPAGTGEQIRAFYGRLVTSEQTLSEHLRFSYQFTDPNTAAYFLLIAAAPLFMAKRGSIAFVLLTAVVVLLTFITQSKGALVALALVVLIILYPPDRFMATAFSLRRMALLFVLVIAAYFAYAWLSEIFESNALLRLAYERIFEAGDQISTGGSRFETWRRFLGEFTPLPFGRGFILLIGGIYERPHSDFIRILFSYGLVALIPTLIWFFGRIMTWPALIIPGLMAFLVNSLIDEQKLLALFLSLLAIQIGNEDRRLAAASDPDFAHAR